MSIFFFFFSKDPSGKSKGPDKLHVLRERLVHYESLLRDGWEATRWEHPKFGVSERLPSGKWRETLPDGRSIEYGGNDGAIRLGNWKGITVNALDTDGKPVSLRFGDHKENRPDACESGVPARAALRPVKSKGRAG